VRRMWALLLSLLLLAVPAVATAGIEAPELDLESDAAHGQYSAGQFRHRVLPQAITTIRVALARTSTSETADAGFNHTAASLAAASGFALLDAAGNTIAQGDAGQTATVRGGPEGYTITLDADTYGPFASKVTFRPENGDMALLTYATRVYPGTSSKTYKYRGEIEVRPGSAAGTFRLINALNIEHYLRGLAELPTFWALEALKAQTVAARSYAAMRIGTPAALANGFDLYDTILSQAYNGALRETAKQDQAVAETAGLVVSYNQQVADCYYSSSSGGHTENNEYVFAATLSDFPSTPIPYLRGKFDSIPATPDLDLTTEEGVRTFYTNTYPEHFDSQAVSGNAYYRWTATWTRANLETILNTYLRVYGTSGWVTPAFPADGAIGTLTDLRVEGRGTAGKALSLVIEGTNGTWTVHKEFYIRWILRPTPTLTLRSANFFLDITRDADGAITTVKATGGGFGHGVGMDQYGVRGMVSKGYNFAEVLYHYYTGAKVSTVPLEVRRLTGVPMDEAFRQEFYSPTGGGTLEVTMNGLTNLQAVVNGHMITVNAADCEDGRCEVEISQWMTSGMNEIIYVPVGSPDGSAIVTVAVR